MSLPRNKSGNIQYPTPCLDCGVVLHVSRGLHLKGVRCHRCGVLKGKTILIEGVISSKHPLRSNLRAMKARCSRPTCKFFDRYGGRGIKVCDEWAAKGGIKAFAEWALANGWKPGLQIDRIDNDGNYEPGNCQWITKGENTKKAHARPVSTPSGVFSSVKEAAAGSSIANGTLIRWLKEGREGFSYQPKGPDHVHT